MSATARTHLAVKDPLSIRHNSITASVWVEVKWYYWNPALKCQWTMSNSTQKDTRFIKALYLNILQSLFEMYINRDSTNICSPVIWVANEMYFVQRGIACIFWLYLWKMELYFNCYRYLLAYLITHVCSSLPEIHVNFVPPQQNTVTYPLN